MESRQTVLIIIAVILGLFIYNGKCAHFEYGDGQQPCILLDIDATFDLSMGTQMADPFSIEGANTIASQSLCGSEIRSAMLSLSLFPSNEQLKITFRREASTQVVSMSVVLTLDPLKHFENASGINPFELEDSDDLPVGMRNMSYKCNSQQEMVFNQDPGYAMTMKITNLHVQAFDVENGTFSPAIECDQDLATTGQTTRPSSKPTTEEQTTVSTSPTTPIENETTPETPATIAPETTTPTPEPETITLEPVPTTTPKIIPKYEVKDGDTVCVVVQGEMKFNINYERNDSQTGSAIISLSKDAKVSGQCKYYGSNTTQEFNVRFFNDTWSFSVLISQDEESMLKSSGSLLQDLKAEPSYTWKRVELTYVVEKHFFPDAKDSDIGQRKNVTKDESEGVFRASGDGSYKCNTGETLELQEGVSIDLGNFQYKAFGTDNSGNFTNNDVSVCPADDSNIDNDNNNNHTTLIIVLTSVFGSIVVITSIVITVWRCRKNRKPSGNSRRKLLSDQTYENYESSSSSIVKGSDECRDTIIKKDTKQAASLIQSTSSRRNEIGQVSGRQNQQPPQDSNSDRGNVFDII